MRPLRHGDPRSFGRFRILARIGTGGMAVVYFGRSVSGRAVAVKAVHRDLAGQDAYRERFRREVAATRAAGGRYSPSVVDADPDAAIPWLAMEFLPAVSLREIVATHGPLTAESAWPLLAGVVEAVASIHQAGVVHLDLTPANVLLTADGPKVVDFGIALFGASRETAAGSPGYRSPEQAAGGPVGPASDVYTLGATIAFAVGPHSDDALRVVIADCQRDDPADRPTVPELTAYLADRPAGMDWLPPVVTDEIGRRAEGPPEPGPSRRAVLTSGAAVVVGAAAGVTALVLGGNRSVPGAAAPAPNVTTTESPTTTVAPIDSPATKPLEVQLAGTLLLHTMTLSVNGAVVQEHTNLQLPWGTFVDVPADRSITWRIDYRSPAGELTWAVGIADAWIDHDSRDLTESDNVGFVTGTH